MEKLIPDEFDPYTGIHTQTGVVDDKLVIRQDSDVSAALDYATKLRNAEQYSRDGIKKGFWHAAEIPMAIVTQLKDNGVDVFRASAKEIVAGLKKINAEHFLTTTKRV